MNMYFLMNEFISGGAMRCRQRATQHIIIAPTNLANRKMRASVSVVVRCGCGTEPTAVVQQ